MARFRFQSVIVRSTWEGWDWQDDSGRRAPWCYGLPGAVPWSVDVDHCPFAFHLTRPCADLPGDRG